MPREGDGKDRVYVIHHVCLDKVLKIGCFWGGEGLVLFSKAALWCLELWP